MNKSQKGDYCELLVLARLVKEGRLVALPFGNQAGWDLLVYNPDSGWERWQIKTARQRAESGKTVYVDFIRTRDRNNGRGGAGAKGYKESEFDWLIAVLPDTGQMWQLPISECANRRCRTFSVEEFVWKQV